jgi:hypothetical protein
MPTKYKASRWSPPGLEVLEEPLKEFHLSHLDKVARLVPKVRSEKNFIKLKNSIAATVVELAASVRIGRKPSVPEQRAALLQIGERARELARNLQDLDADTKKLIEEAYLSAFAEYKKSIKSRSVRNISGRNSLSLSKEVTPGSKKVSVLTSFVAAEYIGGGAFAPDIAFSRDVRVLHTILEMVSCAEKYIGPARRGRRRNEAVRQAITRLHEAWIAASFADATKKPFMRFVSETLRPVVPGADLDGPVREVLYGSKAGKQGHRVK